MHPYKHINITSKPYPLSDIENPISPMSLAITAETRLASSAPFLLQALQSIANDPQADRVTSAYAKSVLAGLGFPLT